MFDAKIYRALLANKLILALVFSLSSFLAIELAHSQSLYSYKGPRGSVTFTSKPPRGKRYKKVRARKPSYSTIRRSRGRSRSSWAPRTRASVYDDLIKQLAVTYKLEPALVKAMIHTESAFKLKARSPKGARGLMQLIPATAKRFGVKNSYDAAENILGGVRYLKWLFRHFDGNLTHVIAGYNAGENAVTRYGGIPPYRETQDYVRRVLALRKLYTCDYSGKRMLTKC